MMLMSVCMPKSVSIVRLSGSYIFVWIAGDSVTAGISDIDMMLLSPFRASNGSVVSSSSRFLA